MTTSSSSKPVSSVRHWAAKWVWCGGNRKPYHFFLLVRRSFALDALPKSARIHVTASDRYKLYVNGVYIGRGPARSDPRRKNYDSYDLAPHLRVGRNVVAIRAYHYGSPARGDGWGSFSGNAYTIGERAGLFAQIETVAFDGSTTVLGTDESWCLIPACGWDRTAKMINVLVGTTEIYDARVDPPDWMGLDFDDSGWTPATVLPDSELDWVVMEARYTPLLEEREAFPDKIVEVGEVIDQGRLGQTDIPELLFQEAHFTLENAVVHDIDAMLGDQGESELQGRFLRGEGIRVPYVILDFGRQVIGFPTLRLRAEKGSIIDVTYSQKLQAGRIDTGHRYGDRYISRDGDQTWEVAEYKQFRYMQLTARSTYAPVHVQSVFVNQYLYPAEPQGRFESSDPLLDAIWKSCVETTYLNMEDTLVHEGYRERAIFNTGDGSHLMHMIFAVYGALPLTDRFLRLVPLSERGDGMMQMVYPPENPERNVVVQFLLQWSTRVKEHYLYTGRRPVLEELYRSVPPQIDWYEPHRDSVGLLRDLPLSNTIDWAPVDLRGANIITNAMYVAGLEDAAWLAHHVGIPRDVVRWRRIAAEVRATLRDMFWNDAKGLFEDSHHEGGLTGVFSELGNALAMLYHIATDDQAARIAERLAVRDALLVPTTPLFFGYVADALMMRGFSETSLSLVRERFEPMITATDNPTIWEMWDPYTGGERILTQSDYEQRNRHKRVRPMSIRSLAHTGGVLIGHVLSTRVLGVIPTGPGFSNCSIHPRIGDLASCKGIFPTPKGGIEVEWRKIDGYINLAVSLPNDTDGEIVVDYEPSIAGSVTYNGVTALLNDQEALRRVGVILEDTVLRVQAGPGPHSLELRQMSL